MLTTYTYGNDTILRTYQRLIKGPPHSENEVVKVWTIHRDEYIRINYVEMYGELSLHRHPDARHSLMVLEGRVRVQLGKEFKVLQEYDFISIPKNLPHKYWALTSVVKLVSMDAPYYDPKLTVRLE